MPKKEYTYVAPKEINSWLTPAMHRLLSHMIHVEDELAMSGINVYVGTTRFSRGTVLKLLDLCLIRPDTGSMDSTYWHMTPCARRVIEDLKYEPAIVTARRTGKPVFR